MTTMNTFFFVEEDEFKVAKSSRNFDNELLNRDARLFSINYVSYWRFRLFCSRDVVIRDSWLNIAR